MRTTSLRAGDGGPMFTDSVFFWVTFLIYYAGAAAHGLSAFLGPLHEVPFGGNVFHYATVVAMIILLMNLANRNGLLPTEHPQEPRSSSLI
jgi:hypothetical protein